MQALITMASALAFYTTFLPANHVDETSHRKKSEERKYMSMSAVRTRTYDTGLV